MARQKWLIAALLLALVAGVAGLWAGGLPARAQSGPHFNLGWHVIGGGGWPIASAHYAVNATAGQEAASPPLLAGPHYVVNGGFWYAAPALSYLPLLTR